jgi:hypothetical protein
VVPIVGAGVVVGGGVLQPPAAPQNAVGAVVGRVTETN